MFVEFDVAILPFLYAEKGIFDMKTGEELIFGSSLQSYLCSINSVDD
ncbi:UNVERIFIED_CONTAM: hypothetical protein N8J90_09880 [Halobacillus marinus]|nr:hypothetical protein [Bacillus sp. SB49]QHT47670.1 hypothetical protein M662_14655 [Bacillus sp. SB49]